MAKRKVQEQPKPSPAKLTQITSYRRGTGIFRPRMIKWSPSSYVTATFAMNPYTMGVVAVNCISLPNFLPMLSGGTPDLTQKFSPPPQYRDAFAAAYKIIKGAGKYLTPSDGQFVEVKLGQTIFGRVLHDNEYQEWDKYFLDRTSEFEEIHNMLSAAGVSETDIKTVTLDEAMEFNPTQAMALADAMNDKVRVGLDY